MNIGFNALKKLPSLRELSLLTSLIFTSNPLTNIDFLFEVPRSCEIQFAYNAALLEPMLNRARNAATDAASSTAASAACAKASAI